MAGAKNNPGMRRQAGNALQPYFPETVAVRRDVDARVADALAQSDYARAFGASVGQVARIPGAVHRDIVTPPLRAVASGVSAFIGGLTGSRGGQAIPKPTRLTAKAPAVAAVVKPAAAAAAKAPTTPQEKQLAFLDNVFGGALTLNQAVAASGMLPAPPKAMSPKDSAIATTSDLSLRMLEKQLAQAKTLGGAAGDKAGDSAAQAFFDRQAMIIGSNPVNLRTAGMMPEDMD